MRKRGSYEGLAFLLPVLWVLPVYIGLGLAPFGDRSLLAIDAWGQYFPMLKEMRRAIASGSVSWSFHGGLGFNLWAQSAYYTNSPLWGILYLIPEAWMIAGVDLIVLVKFGLCGLTFARMWAVLSGKKDGIGLVFAQTYALCGYNLAFINQFMWADVVVLFPLVVSGLWKLCGEESALEYLAALSLSIFSNFYIGYMACIGSVCFFLLIEWGQARPVREHGRHLFRFCLYSLLAGGLAAVSLIPVYQCLQLTIASGLGFDGTWRWYHTLWELLCRLIPFGEVSLQFEAPNLYTGLLTAVFAAGFFCRKQVPLRRKIGAALLAGFLLISFNLNGLDYFWHGFHYPNQLPGRQSFLFSFLLALLGADAFSGWKRRRKRCWVRAALLVLALETGLNSVYVLASQTRVTNAVEYASLDEEMAEAIEACGAGEEDFWRIERLPRWNFNPGQLYGYDGVTYYSSTMSEKAYHFFRSMGLPVYARNVSTLYEQTPVLNLMFGVRYLLDTNGENGNETMEEAGTAGRLIIRENRYRLPVAFRAEKTILAYEPDSDASGIRNQNDWVKAAGASDRDLLKELPTKEKQAFAWELDEEALSEAWERLVSEGMQVTSRTASSICGRIRCEEAGILHTTLPNDGGWRIRIDGEEQEILELAGYFCGAEIEAGEHEVRITYEVPGLRTGALLSAASLLLAAAALIRERRRRTAA